MKKFIVSLCVMVLPIAALAATDTVAQAPQSVAVAAVDAVASKSPQAVVQSALDSLTDRLAKEKGHLKNNSKLLHTIIEENITPYVDIDGIARGVMGQYYRQASSQQKTEFESVFKESLIRTYANGLAAYNNQKIVVKPYKPGSDPKKAQINVEVTGDTGTVYPVTFQMRQDGQGQWKAQNLLLNGINLGLTFRNQFAAAVSANNGDISKAIANWTPDTAALEKKDKP